VSDPDGSNRVRVLPESETLRGWFPGGRFKRAVPALELAEARHLAKEARRVLKDTSATRIEADGRDWVTYRFEGLLLRLLFQSYKNARDHLVINATVIAGGFATSGLAVTATKSGSHGGSSTTVAWVVFAIGLAVALAGGISQLYRPGHRATGYSALVARLRDEAWALGDGHGDYTKDDPKELFAVFDARLNEIRADAAELAMLSDRDSQQSRRRRRLKRNT
jgi:hypothetical protein